MNTESVNNLRHCFVFCTSVTEVSLTKISNMVCAWRVVGVGVWVRGRQGDVTDLSGSKILKRLERGVGEKVVKVLVNQIMHPPPTNSRTHTLIINNPSLTFTDSGMRMCGYLLIYIWNQQDGMDFLWNNLATIMKWIKKT